MIELTGRQKRFLRGRGQRLPAAVILGKAGLSEALVRQIAEHLRRHELIKVRLPAGPPSERKAVAADLADGVGAACLGTVGRTTLLYRPNCELPDDQRIALP